MGRLLVGFGSGVHHLHHPSTPTARTKQRKGKPCSNRLKSSKSFIQYFAPIPSETTQQRRT